MGTTDLGAATRDVRSRRRRSPRRLARLLRVVAIGLPASVIAWTVWAPVAELAAAVGVPAPGELGVGMRVALVILSVMPVLATAIALEALRRCALAVHDGRGMTLEVAQGLRAAGSWMLAASVAALVVPTLAALVLSAPTGQLIVRVNLGSGVVLPMVLAGALRLIAGVIVEAAALADENAQIV